MRRIALAAATLFAIACSSKDAPGPHPVGAESFVSTAPRGSGGAVPAAGGTAGPVPEGDAGGAAQERAIVEADLYVRAGSMLYVQNAWRGLQVVDLVDPARPRLRSRVPLTGTPVGLYLRGAVALVASSDHFQWNLEADALVPSRESRLWAIDVSDAAAPRILAEVAIPGALEETRLVGDVLYAVSRTSPYWDARPALGGPAVADAAVLPDATVVQSFDVSSPGAPVAVARLELPAAGWSTHANVTAERITLSRAGWEPAGGEVTLLTAVDISDPGGALAVGAEARIAGLVRDRWGLDFEASTGTFRAVVQSGWNAGARLVVLDWAEPGKVAPRAELEILVPESVTATRFDGARVYVVTARAIDPLWVIDVSDPGSPTLAGHLEMPGQLDHIEPRGDRLVALGHTPEGGGVFQLQVSLLDVSKPSAPALLSRALFGPDWGWVPATPDDLRKAFQVLDGQGLVLVPFQGFDRDTWRWVGGTQLLTLSRDTIQLGGFVPHAGAVKRAFPLEAPGLLGALSDESLQTIDATDPASPVELGAIDLARPVWAIAVAGGAAAELSGDPWRGAAEIVVVPASDLEAAAPTARFPLAGAYGRLFRLGSVAWVLATDPWTGGGVLLAVDLADPAAPRERGRLALPAPEAGQGWWSAGAVQVGRALAVQRQAWRCAAATCESEADLLAIDLADPDAPRLAATVPLPARAWTSGIRAEGTSVWYSQYEWVERWPAPGVRYLVGRVDLADPSAPVVSAPVNVPGSFFSASEDGSTVYTEELHWPSDASAPRTFLHALGLTDRGTARLLASVELPGAFGGATRAGAFAYATGSDPATGRARLAAVSLDAMAVTASSSLDASWAWTLKAAGGKLFLSEPWPQPSILVYDLADPARPAFERAVRHTGWIYDVVVEGNVAYLPAGYGGVPTVDLAP